MNHLSTLTLHRLALGELDPAAAATASAHLAACGACRDRADAVDVADREARDGPLPPWAAATAPPSAWALFVRRTFPAATALAAAAVMLLMALPAARRDPGDGNRTRGALPAMEVWVQRADGLRPLEVGDALSAGDRVQLWYDPRNADAVGFAGRDGTGAIEV